MKIGMSKLRFFILFCIICSPGLMIPQLIVNDEPSIQDVPLMTETVMKNTVSMSMPFYQKRRAGRPPGEIFTQIHLQELYTLLKMT